MIHVTNTEFHTPRLTLHFRHPFFRTIIPTPTPLPSERGQIWQPVHDDPDPAPSDDESYPSQDDFGSSATIATEPLLHDNHFTTQQTGYYPLQHIQPQRPTPQSNQHHYPQPQQHRPQRSASRGRRPQAPQWSGRKQPPQKPQRRAPVRHRPVIDPTVRYQKSVVRSERWYDILEAMLMSIPMLKSCSPSPSLSTLSFAVGAHSRYTISESPSILSSSAAPTLCSPSPLFATTGEPQSPGL